MKLIHILIISILLFGCSHNKPFITQEWMIMNQDHPELKVKDFEKDRELCQYEASKATSGGGYAGWTTWEDDIIRNNARRAAWSGILMQCLHIKGWWVRDDKDDDWS